MYLLLSFACAPADTDSALSAGDDPVVIADADADADADTDADADADADTDTDADADAPAWTDVFPLLESHCGGCHESDYFGHFVVVGDAAATHALLLEAPPIQGAGLRYVVPRDLTASLLVEKIGDDPTLGEPMPPEGSRDVTPLTTEEVALIEDWVRGGAPG